MTKRLLTGGLMLALTSTTAFAATDITWWHGMGGRNGEVINEIADEIQRSAGRMQL